LYEAQFQT